MDENFWRPRSPRFMICLFGFSGIGLVDLGRCGIALRLGGWNKDLLVGEVECHILIDQVNILPSICWSYGDPAFLQNLGNDISSRRKVAERIAAVLGGCSICKFG